MFCSRLSAMAGLASICALGLFVGCTAGGGGGGGTDDPGGQLAADVSASTEAGDVGQEAGTAEVGDPVTLSATATGGTPPYYYDWWIQDGPNGPDDPEVADSESAEPSVTFTEPGTYTIGLIITDDAGDEIERFYEIEVTTESDDDEGAAPLDLAQVQFWGYQIQAVDQPGAVDALAASGYDMLVLEPTRTDWSSDARDFDTPGMVDRLKSTLASDGVHRKLVIAYIDIGQAEDWRWYWDPGWSEEWPVGEPKPDDWPDYIITHDPDGWVGNYPVAYWDEDWKDIIISGQNQDSAPHGDYTSVIDEVLKSGFDGIYLDWVEAFEDEDVMAAAAALGLDPAEEMIAFIEEMRTYAEARDPDFIIIQQNAASLIDGHPELADVIDAIAQEAIWFDGDATDDWEDPDGYDFENNQGLVDYYLGHLDDYQAAGLPVFACEYALDSAAEAYQLSETNGFVPYATRRSLGQLTTTPPPGYPTDCPCD